MSEYKSGETEKNKIKKAVALAYDSDTDKAPVVMASGSGYIAERIIETADRAGVPVYKDETTTTLLAQLELGKEVPYELYEVTAQILAYILKLSDEMKNRKYVEEVK